MRRLATLIVLSILAVGCSRGVSHEEAQKIADNAVKRALATTSAVPPVTSTTQPDASKSFEKVCSASDGFCVAYEDIRVRSLKAYATTAKTRSRGDVSATGYNALDGNGSLIPASAQFVVVSNSTYMAPTPQPSKALLDVRDWSWNPRPTTWIGFPAQINSIEPDGQPDHINEVLKVWHNGKIYMLFSINHTKDDPVTSRFWASLTFTN